MKKFIILILTIFTLIIVSIYSSKNNYRLTDLDIKINPYKVGDSLFLSSDKGEKDTLIIDSFHKAELEEKCYSFLTCIYTKLAYDTWEVFNVNTIKPKEDWKGKSILTIRAEPDGSKTVLFELYTINAWWYSNNDRTVQNLISDDTITYHNGIQKFTDVLVLKSNDNQYSHRENYIESIYWSKLNGLIGFEKLNGTKWSVQLTN
jgi:hypothetical protein